MPKKKKSKKVVKKKATPFAKIEAAIRQFAMGFPEVREDHPWGESAYKVKGKCFTFSHAGSEFFTVTTKLPDSHQLALDLPFASPTGYGLGKSGWVTAKFTTKDKIPLGVLEQWIEESYRAIAPKKLVKSLA